MIEDNEIVVLPVVIDNRVGACCWGQQSLFGDLRRIPGRGSTIDREPVEGVVAVDGVGQGVGLTGRRMIRRAAIRLRYPVGDGGYPSHALRIAIRLKNDRR